MCVRVESLAGIRHEYDDSQINYYFRDDSLFAIKYSFGTYYSSAKITAIYNDLYDVLCAKYGNPSEKSQIIDTPIAENFSAWDTEEYAHEFVYAMATDSGSVFIDIAIESGYDVGYRLYVGYRFVPAEELQALQSAYEARDAERLEAMFRDL